MKALLITAFVLSIGVSLYAQDSLSIRNMQQMPAGIYLSETSFFSKTPDLTTIFSVLVNYKKSDKGDSVAYGNTIQFADSTKKKKGVFAFADSSGVYMQAERNVFFKFDGFGRHPYIFMKEPSYNPGTIAPTSLEELKTDILSTAIFGAASTLHKRRIYLYYYNKKHMMVRATPESIGFLLKGEKDLFEAYGNEQKKTTEVMLKYLDKMNERYPNL